MNQLITSVTKVSLSIEKSNPPQLLVKATGRANSAECTNAELTPVEYVVVPQDGIQDFEFIVEAPETQLATDAEITGVSEMIFLPWMQGVRVRGATNEITLLINEQGCAVKQNSVRNIAITLTSRVPGQQPSPDISGPSSPAEVNNNQR